MSKFGYHLKEPSGESRRSWTDLIGRPASRNGLFTILAIGLLTIGWNSLEVVGVSPTEASVTEVRQAINEGAAFERSRNWSDAIIHYRDSLELWPDHEELKYGLRRAKFHMQIDRRYTDTSYKKELMNLSERHAIELLDEVLYKIHGHYVDSVSSTYFIAHGTESIYLALNNEAFLEENGIFNTGMQQLKQSRKMLFDQYWNKPVNGPDEAKQIVLEVADRLNRSTGIKKVPVILEYVFGGCNSLDDYSAYLTPGKLSDLYSNIEGEFVGLGIEMKSEVGKGVHLVNVLPESPAEEGGLLSGDYITHIDQVDVLNKPTDEAATLITGKQGTRVHLRWTSTDGREKTGYFTRREVKVKSIPFAEILDSKSGIGYIRLAGFQRTTAEEFDAALMKLKREGMKSLIWDVRGNPGGLLTAAVEVLDRLIDRGVLVSTKGRTNDQNWTYSAHSLGTWNFPIVLLIDGNSASASEIVAGAIRDHQRGTLVGRKSYGKWSVQSIYPVSHSCGLRLTTAKFYSPNGHNHSEVGVEPDVFVERDKKEPVRVNRDALMSDADVLKALELLQDTQLTRTP
ncbi:MAG: S41 family peptidase [Rubinisphaera brasiliensis]|uniref:S41 family peptidase n=1 Tax=Rubinisphaera brasiliensis TaxID=119 RepID=UPI00391A3884